jgi:TetR/AcrR family transcriptional regulator, transcriptional repressor for nem operon
MEERNPKQALIEVGVDLLKSTGYAATGINQIADAAQTRSFYTHFTNKDAFVIEAIKFYSASEQQHLDRIKADAALSPVKKLRRYFEDKIEATGHRSGRFNDCLLGRLSLEIAGSNSEIRHLLRQSFDQWQASIAATLREAIDRGELSRTVSEHERAAIILDTWEGAQVRAKADRSDKALDLFLNSTFHILLKTREDPAEKDFLHL